MTRNFLNRMMARSTKLGLSVRGSRVLHVRGRASGEIRTVPVNPLTIDGRQYLVAPRGTTQWVRNLRAAGSGELQLGRRSTPFTAAEITGDGEKVAILRDYLRIWKSEVGRFFDGIDATATDEQLRGIAPAYPVFAIRPGDQES